MKMDSTEIQEDINFFDKNGFVPSRNVKTIDDYLQESEDKLRTIERFSRDPRKFIFETLGIHTDIEVLFPSEEWQRRFHETFLTEPMPGIYADPTDFKTIMTSHSSYERIRSYLFRLLPHLRVKGTILDFRGNRSNTYIPIIKKEKKDDDEILEILCHEGIHCVRSQHKESSLREALTYQFAEESVAYSIYEPRYTKSYLRIFPSLMIGFELLPMIIAAQIFNPTLHISTLAIVGTVTYYGNKTVAFFNRCEDEGLNPYYLFLRSSPSEYSRRKPIRDQLNENDNLRFKIMANRLGVN